VEEEALYCLVYVAASQCSTKDGLNDTWACTACPQAYALTEVTVVDESGHQALLGYDPARDRIVLALRGTLSFMDVIDDLENAVAVKYGDCEGCKVGAGWLDATTKLMGSITEALEGLVGKWGGAEIWITGHSLGAAMAPLVVRRLKVDEVDIYEKIRFPGEPVSIVTEYCTAAASFQP